MKRTQTELAAIFVYRTQADKWQLKEFEDPADKGHYNLVPPVGHLFLNYACTWSVLQLENKVIFIPSYAFSDDPEPEQDKYAFIGGELDQKVCSVGNPAVTISYNGEKYRQLKADAVTFYAHESLPELKAAFLYYMATDNGVGQAKSSRN